VLKAPCSHKFPVNREINRENERKQFLCGPPTIVFIRNKLILVENLTGNLISMNREII
jgi:hypothetical protein